MKHRCAQPIRLALATVIAALPLLSQGQQNPHDGYAFWLPCGELKLGDAKSEKEFQVKRDGAGISFVVHPRRTRFDVPAGQMVVVMAPTVVANKAIKAWPILQMDGTPAKPLLPVVFLDQAATKGKADIRLAASGLPKQAVLRFYWSDDSDKLGFDVSRALYAPDANSPADRYHSALVDLVSGRFEQARHSFLGLQSMGLPSDKLAARRTVRDKPLTTDGQRLCRRMARWCDAEIQFGKIKTGPGYYDLGLSCMVNGFWDLAEKSFRQATVKMPRNPDAWYMLADALSYQSSDLDTRMEQIAPFYRKAADLYPSTNSNTFRTHFGFFRNLRIKDGDKTTVLHMSDEQMAYAKKAWGWCSAIMEAASRGTLRMVNTYKVYDQEFDSTRDWDPRPFNGLFKPGTVDTFIKMTGWGASDCCGMDTGPDRSAFINLGIREWDVMLHEWNHSLDWAMIGDELGVGVPETHASDWCGFEPISSMGMGHHSCNRYYMTPGMYRYVRGSDPATTPHVADWLVGKPISLMPDAAKLDDAYNKALLAKTRGIPPPPLASLTAKPRVVAGYVDLGATWPDVGTNATAFARTYVYSPQRQKVRMWLTGDDNIRVWQNGKLVHKGVYWSTCQFLGFKMKDQIAGALLLEKGWNSLLVQVTSSQQGPDWQTDDVRPEVWGFSLRFCDIQNRAVPGLKWQAQEPRGFRTPVAFVVNPRRPKTYRWEDVADDYTTLLPQLTVQDLRAITGYSTMTVTDAMLWDLSGEQLAPAASRSIILRADPKKIGLDNQLNWFFSPKELVAFVRYRRGNQWRDLVFIRPEGHEAFMRLMAVSPAARKLGIQRHADRVIGTFMVPRPDSPNGRGVVVLDTYLGDMVPSDEEALLEVGRLR